MLMLQDSYSVFNWDLNHGVIIINLVAPKSSQPPHLYISSDDSSLLFYVFSYAEVYCHALWITEHRKCHTNSKFSIYMPRSIRFPADPWRNDNDVATSSWRDNDVIITSCVHWGLETSEVGIGPDNLTLNVELFRQGQRSQGLHIVYCASLAD